MLFGCHFKDPYQDDPDLQTRTAGSGSRSHITVNRISHLAPLVFVEEEHITHVERVHHKQQKAGLVDVPDVVAKNEDKRQQGRGEAQPHLLHIHLQSGVPADAKTPFEGIEWLEGSVQLNSSGMAYAATMRQLPVSSGESAYLEDAEIEEDQDDMHNGGEAGLHLPHNRTGVLHGDDK